jgi:hypothetical protein
MFIASRDSDSFSAWITASAASSVRMTPSSVASSPLPAE